MTLGIYALITTYFGYAETLHSAINLTVLRISFFGIAAGIYLLATERTGHFWICLAIIILGFAVLSTALKASVVMTATMALFIVVAGLSTPAIRCEPFFWSLIVALTVGITFGLVQNHTVLQLRASQALALNQSQGVGEAPATTEWVTRTLDFYDIDPEVRATTAWPDVVKPSTCLAVADETRMTAAQFVDVDVPEEAWRCIFVDRTARLRLYLEAAQQFIASPLLGTGFGSYEVKTREFDFHTYTYPHNVPLEVLGSAGLIIFVIFCASVVSFFWAACQSLPTNPEVLAAVIFLPSILVASLFGGDVYDFRFYLVAALPFCSSGHRCIGFKAPRSQMILTRWSRLAIPSRSKIILHDATDLASAVLEAITNDRKSAN